MTSRPPLSLSSVCVFCGSASGNDPRFVEAASLFGRALAERGLTLVYGGGRVGLMGAVADGALGAGGRVVGVMPRGLVEREIAHVGLSELRVVETMHERKTAMSEVADAFAVLPGGAGTLEEAFEQWTWAQLAIHAKPVGFLDVPIGYAATDNMLGGGANAPDPSDSGTDSSKVGSPSTDGYFAPLLAMIDRMVASGFLAPAYRDMLIVERDPAALLAAFECYEPPGRKGYESAARERAPMAP